MTIKDNLKLGTYSVYLFFERPLDAPYRLQADFPPANMSVLEAREYLNISERKLRDLIACAALRYARIGKRIILRKQDLDSFLEGRVI